MTEAAAGNEERVELRRKRDNWYVCICGANNEVMLVSETFSTRNAAWKAAEWIADRLDVGIRVVDKGIVKPNK